MWARVKFAEWRHELELSAIDDLGDMAEAVRRARAASVLDTVEYYEWGIDDTPPWVL